ncbi:MAG: class I SAM-dependent methyltransferase [Chloroflexi bacterium]|nr:class I SAM-dependent methyltransferase [Chloroflexota bacterium]
MKCNQVDPELYDKRFESVPREGYLDTHWRPLVRKAIAKYCHSKNVALDIGCGTGAYFMPMLEEHAVVVGLDISLPFLMHGKNRNRSLNLLRGDAHTLPIKNNSIDTVTCNLFEYVDREIVAGEIYRVLKKDGICLILTPNKYSLCRMPLKLGAKALRKKNSVREASRKELANLFQRNGLEMVECRMDDGLIWLPNSLDRWSGKRIYSLIEGFFRPLGCNPFSNMMLIVVRKTAG